MNCPEDCPVRQEVAAEQRRFEVKVENRLADLQLKLEYGLESMAKRLESLVDEWRSLSSNVIELLDMKKHGTNGSGGPIDKE